MHRKEAEEHPCVRMSQGAALCNARFITWNAVRRSWFHIVVSIAIFWTAFLVRRPLLWYTSSKAEASGSMAPFYSEMHLHIQLAAETNCWSSDPDGGSGMSNSALMRLISIRMLWACHTTLQRKGIACTSGHAVSNLSRSIFGELFFRWICMRISSSHYK